MAPEIISYADAKSKGLKRYFTGKPCKRGHFAERNVANCACIECQAIVTERWGAENKEVKLQFARDWRGKNPNYSAEWAKNNPDSIRVAKRKWYVGNTYRAIEIAKDWQRRNPEKRRTNTANARARRVSAEGSHTAAEIQALLERQDWKCAEPSCRKSIRKKRHIDHIMPLDLGGSNYITNLQGLCPTCNCRKNAKHPLDWARENGRLL